MFSVIRLFSGAESHVYYQSRPPSSGLSEKTLHFPNLFSNDEKQTNSPQVLQKTSEVDPEIHKNDFCWNMVWEYLPNENSDLRDPSFDISTSKFIENCYVETSPNTNWNLKPGFAKSSQKKVSKSFQNQIEYCKLQPHAALLLPKSSRVAPRF